MMCDKCKQETASIHSVSIINGEKKEQHLCANCAAQYNMHYSFPSIIELLSGFSVMPKKTALPLCSCGSSFEMFQKTGILGCKDCYIVYREPLMQVIKRVQGGKTRHVGRIPAGYEKINGAEKEGEVHTEHVGAKDEKAKEVNMLKKELKKAIDEENYERAAELRDRLKLLEGVQGK